MGIMDHCFLYALKGWLPGTAVSHPSGLQAIPPSYICLRVVSELLEQPNTRGSG